MPHLSHPNNPQPGVPIENAFWALTDEGMRCGQAFVLEYTNHVLLPDRPLNYYITVQTDDERAFDMLMGATLTRAMELRAVKPNLAARIYTPCRPHDGARIRALSAFGFQNDDAVIRMRRICSLGDRPARAPVGCLVAPVMLQDEDDEQALLNRMNAYAVTMRDPAWLQGLRQDPLFLVQGMWRESSLLGEMILTAHGAEGRIEMLYTRPEYRGRGVASALIASAGEELLQHSIRSLTAEIWRRNIPAMDLFTDLGFESMMPTVLYPGMDV